MQRGSSVLGGPFIGGVAYRLADRLERERVSALCSERFSDRAASLSRELHDITDELRHVRSLFLSSNHISRDQFRAFTAEIPTRHPAIVAVEWVPRIAGYEREALEGEARREGLLNFRISVPDPDGSLTSAPAKDEYYPVFFAEPLSGNRRALGFDISSERVRRSALVWANLTREPSVSDPIDLPSVPKPSNGFLVMLPVYRTASAAPAQSSDLPDGIVQLVVRTRDLFDRMIGAYRDDGAPDMYFELMDEDVGGRPAVIAASAEAGAEPDLSKLSFGQSIEVGGQRWRLTGRPTSEFESRHLTNEPVILGTGVFFLWELLGGLALSLVRQARDAAFSRQSRIYRTALQALSEGVVVADLEGRLVLFNDAAQTILGIDHRQTTASGWLLNGQCFDPKTQAPLPPERLPLALALQGAEDQAEILIRTPEISNEVWATMSGMPLRDEDGALEGGVVTLRDITASRKAEAQVRASFKQLEDLRYAVDQSSLVATTDKAGDIIYVNDKFAEACGYSREELLGKNHRILKSGYHPPAFYEDLWKTISSGRVWRGRIRNRARDGHDFWVDTTIVPVLVDGRPERYLSLRTDVTEEMRQQAELQRLSNAVEQTADAIVITDHHGVIEYVNPAFETTTGYSRAEALGRTPRILKSGKQPPEFYEQLWKTISAGEVYRGAPINRKKSGELYQAEQTITPIRGPEGHIVHFVSVIKDVTDRIRIQQQEIEMQYAADVQQKLYPPEAPKANGFDIAGMTFPAKATCGDYFDYLPLPGGEIDIVIADVSGHGLGPALIMAETRAYLRFLSGSCNDPGAVLDAINQELCADLDDNRYVALILARLDVVSRTIVYVNAGHTAAYHLGADGAVKAVMDSCGPPLGILPHQHYQRTITPMLQPGDIVVFLTDGVTETGNESDEFFGVEAALDVVRRFRADSAAQIVKQLERATREFAGEAPQQDDVTVVVVKVEDPGPG